MDETKLKELLEKMNASTVDSLEKVMAKIFASGAGNPLVGKDVEKKDKKFEGNFNKKLGEFALAAKDAVVTGKIDERLLQKAPSGMNEADPSAGGYAVVTDVAEKLIEDTMETGLLLSRCNRLPVSANSNGMRFHALDETARTDGNRQGGVQAYWENEAAQMTSTKPKFREVNMRLNKLTGLCYVTDEMLGDANFLGAYLSNKFVNEFGFKIDDAIVNGLGAGQPLGLLKSPGLVSIAKETDQAASTVVFNNIVKMYNSMPFRNRMNAIWLVNGEVEDQLPTLKLEGDTGMWPAYMPPGGLSSAAYGLLRGRPVIPIEQCAALGTQGDILFVDLSEYYVIEKGGVDSAVSIHLRFDYNETAFRWTVRLDGQHVRNASLTPYKGSKKLSTAVALDTRA